MSEESQRRMLRLTQTVFWGWFRFALERDCYLLIGVGILLASGCFGDQSSGGNVTRQNVGDGAENSNPISALPDRTGPRNATWHSSSFLVALWCISTLAPLVSRVCKRISAPCALIASVAVSSSNALPCASLPRIRTATCINTR